MAQPSSAQAALSEPCEHKAGIGCALTALPVCCACADKRPVAPAYPVYIDGQGMRMKGKRWSRYCWKCRDFYNFNRSEQGDANTTVEIPAQVADMTPREYANLPSRQLNPEAEPFTLSRVQEPHGNSTAEPRNTRRQAQNRQQRSPPIPIAQRAGPSPRLDQSPHSHPQTGQPHQPPPQIYPLGTREDVEQEDYQSPVGLMFQRAYARFIVAEQGRQEHAAILGIPAHQIRTIDTSSQNVDQRDLPGNQQHDSGYVGVGQPIYPGTNIQLGYAVDGPVQRLPLRESFNPFMHNPFVQPTVDLPIAEDGENPIDRQEGRPEPLTVEELTVNLACKMCMEQKIDTLVEPCMHLAMCRWCSDVWQENARRLRQLDPVMRQPWKCPICRKGIQQVRRVYF